MAYASSLQLVNDANGATHAFLENDGLLWQCEWNAQAQRWDKAQVVPGVYGGEKLQALLVDDLWSTSGITGGQKGNTPGIVLAYRVGEGDGAKVYATLGRWGSDGQLSWTEPLELSDSGIAIEEIALAANGAGGFQLVCQAREPMATGSATASVSEAASAARKDSELTYRSFALSGSDSTGYSLVDTTPVPSTPSTGSIISPQPITVAASPATSAAPAPTVGGNTQFSRNDLQLAPQAPAPQGLLMLSAFGPNGNTSWSGVGLRTSPNKNFSLTTGALIGQTRTRWALQVPNSSPPIDWSVSGKQSATDRRDLAKYRYYDSPTLEAILEVNEIRNLTEAIPASGPSYKNTLGLVGSFGFGGYGSQTVTNDFGLSFIREKKTEIGNLKSSLDLLTKFNAIAGLEQKRNYYSFAANAQTSYQFDSLAWKPSNRALTSVRDTFSVSLGAEHQVRKRYETGGYLQWSIGISGGYAAKTKFASSPDANAPLPKWLGDTAYYVGGLLGAVEGNGMMGFSSKNQGRTVDNLNTTGDFRLNSFNKNTLGNTKDTNKDPYGKYIYVQSANAVAGLGLSLAPVFANLSDRVTRTKANEGLITTVSAGVRYLYKGFAGAYVNVRDSIQWYPKQQNAFSTGSWQNRLRVDAGFAAPFGVSVPLLAFQVSSPKAPPKATTTPVLAASPTSQGYPQGSLAPSVNSQPVSDYQYSAPSGTDYPFLYAPASGSTLLPSASSSAAVPLVGGSATPLKVFTLRGYAAGVVNPNQATSNTPVVLTNAGSGLLEGPHTDVPVMGLSLPGSAPATLNFTVVNGAIDPASVVINTPTAGAGQYLQLPQTTESSGIYALIPDVFSTGILPNNPTSGTGALSSLVQQLPLITVDTSRTGSPLPSPKPIAAIQQAIPLGSAANQQAGLYPNATPSDNSLISYSDVAIAINDPTISLLNQATATVSLSNGTIVKVVLSQPLFFASSTALTPTSLDLTLDLQSVLGSDVVNPTYTVVPQSVGINNVVEDQSYSANPGFPANSGPPTATSAAAQAVWLEDGINAQLQLTPSQAHWPVFNRVVVQSSGGSLTYLNASTTGSNGVVTQSTTDPSKVTLQALYNDLKDPSKYGAVPNFSAASTPTVITLAGSTPPGSTKAKFAGDSAVFWVEASKPVVPQLTSDGSQNYQDYLTALYGQQRINYRIFDANARQPSWSAPNTLDLYAPTNAVIRHLQAFNVELNGSISTLLVWDETSIDTIKGTAPKPIAIQGWISGTTLSLGGSASALRIGDLITGAGMEKGTFIAGILAPFDSSTGNATYSISRSQFVGSSSVPAALNAIPLLPPTVLKAGFINPGATNLQWSKLFTDANGNSTISTIPWDQSNDIGLGIESLSVASQQVIDTNGNVTDTAVLSWSEDVRTPYVQSVLNDEPLIYLQFANLQPGFNDINIGSTASSTTTGTVASSTGLNFTIASALPKSSASAVQNVDGTGVLSTGTGSQNALYTQFLNGTPVNQLPSSPFGQLTGSISGTTLTVTALSGDLAEGDLLTGPGLLPDTQITAILSGFDSASGKGSYTINQSQSLSSTILEAVPNPAPSSGQDLGLPFSSFTGRIEGTTLSVSQLNGSLAVGDGIYGQGVAAGTTITAVLSFDATTGSGSYTLNQSATVPASALIATPSSSVPYTIEFWTKLLAGSNADQGAGLVAFGQPSEQAVGAAIPPSGWLMTAGFSVERISYQQAAGQGFQQAYDKLNAQTVQPGDLFAWGWSLDATGANTTALGGNGGDNLYSNALSLTNLYSGQTLAGVNAFLNSYQLKAADLVGGDGLFANTIDLVPGTSLDFNHSLDPNTGLPVSNLNTISIDTASAQLNSGLVQTINANGDLSSNPATNTNLQTMFQALWNYQEQYGEAKVGFTLDPNATPKSGVGFEQYGGFELDFSVAPGPAISVNGQGQLVFDVADGISITSTATDPSNSREIPLPSDLRDGEWHYVVATYLPDFRQYSINGTATQVPVNRGTATLYVDNQLVASHSDVTDAYIASNINDTALLLANNAGGSVDQFALYNKVLLPAPQLLANPDGTWPVASQQDALAILKQLGYPATDQTPNPGAIESALTEHWRSRSVNPNDALLATFSSVLDPNTGSWSQAAPLNPIPQPDPTTPSATAPSQQQDLVIAIAPKDWSDSTWTTTGSTAAPFNPGGDQLRSITVTLTPDQGGDLVTRQLNPQQVLIGANTTLASLQPKANSSDLHYTILSNQPALNLVISRQAKNQGDLNNLDLSKTYTANISLNVKDPSQITPANVVVTRTITGFNTRGEQVFSAIDGNAAAAKAVKTQFSSTSKALATATVIEAAPLQLKYIDSGVVLNSASSVAAANSPAAASPATSFGQSQAYGWFQTSTVNTYSGWLAIAQTNSANAISNPAGRVWIQYTGDFTSSNALTSTHTAVTDTNKAPITWLNALANSNFSPEGPNRPLLNDDLHQAAYGGLMIQADATAGWGQNFGQTMLVVDVNGDGTDDLVLSAPSANGGGKVVIIDGAWIQANLTKANGSTILNLANPDSLGPHVTVLSPGKANDSLYAADDASQAAFGWALAFDKTSKTLYVGAPNYSRTVGPEGESVSIGAIYHYQNSPSGTTFNAGGVVLASNYAVGIAGSTSTNDVSGPNTSYWGAQLGASLAVSAEGALAAGAPGVQASLLYSGTDAVQQAAAGARNPSTPYGQGALIKIMLPTAASLADQGAGLDVMVSSSDGTSNPNLVDVITKNTTNKKSALAQEESSYMQALKELQTKPIAKANLVNNPAIQTAAVGSVYLFNTASKLPTGTINPAQASSTFYGPNPWNTQGDTDFGASLSFGDLSNTNSQSILSIGAPQSGGPGAVYLVDTSKPFGNPSIAPNWINKTNLGSSTLGYQYLAHLTSALTLYGAEDLDGFGNGVVNLGDVNNDGYTDLLIQASNASGGAGNGYVVFGSDQLIQDVNSNKLLNGSTHNPAVGSVRPGNIGQLSFADGQSLRLPIMAELGHGISAGTALGSYGAGDVDADGNNDILLGSGTNGQAYLTWGHDYLAAINNLQLKKLASDTGYLLDGLATTTQGSLRSIGDFNADGYGDFFSIQPGDLTDTVRIELGANTQEILADYLYNYYSFNVAHGTQVLPGGDINGDGYSDIALFLDQNLSSPAEGNDGAGSTTGILYGRPSDQLPLGSGFGLQAPVDASSTPLVPLPGQGVAGGLTDAAPSVIAVGNTLYAAVKGVGNGDTTIWFTQSTDAGNSWTGWTNLSSFNPGFASNSGPSLAFFHDRLYLGFLNGTNQLALSSWDPNSGDQALWSNPSVLSDGTASPTSNLSPTLIATTNGLSVAWVGNDQTLYGSSTTQDQSSNSGGIAQAGAWKGIANGMSPNNPALVTIGDTTYMAVRGIDNQLYWTSSHDGGQSWTGWLELPTGMTTSDAPSLAAVNGSLYLTYLGSGGNQQLNITQLLSAGTNSWSPQAVLGQTALNNYGAVAIGESVNGTAGLAIYYVANSNSGLILRTWSATPLNASTWTASQQLNAQTASGPLAVTAFNGQTYLAYQGGIPTNSSNTAYLTTAANPSSSSGWSVIATRDPGNHSGIGLSSNATGLLLNTTDSAAGQQAIYALTPASGGGWSQNFSTSSASLSSSATTASILSLPSSGQTPVLLLAGTDPSNSKSVEVNTFYSGDQNNSWLPPQQLLQRIDTNGQVSFQPISASAAPMATLFNDTPVLAVNNNGIVDIYAANASGKTFSLTSSFSPGSGGKAGTTSPGITTTDTGLALSYANADGSISLQRLNFLQLDGTPVEGVVINADGSIDTSNANIQWQGINLAANVGLSSALATVPVNVNGTLLLANVRNSASENTQIWINAVPNLSDPASTTWLNTTVQLGSILSQRTGFENSIGSGLAAGPWQNVGGGAALSPAALTRNGNTVYMAVRGTTNNLYWNSSTDNGKTWNSSWQGLPSTMGTYTAPSIAYFNNTLYLCYVAAGSNDLNITYLQGGNTWKTQYQIPGQSATAAAMIAEGDHLAVYFTANDPSDRILKSYSSQPNNNIWDKTSVLYGGGSIQTASSNLALTRYNDQTYISYQGGTYGNPSNTIYLTTASDTVANGGSPIWSLLDTPAGTNSVLQRGVGLTSGSQGLVLTYTDTNQPNQVAVQLSNADVSDWLALNDSQALSSNIGYTPLITADAQNPLLIAGMGSDLKNPPTNVQLNALDVQVLSRAQTGSSLSSVGDINGDGYDDLAISANNVAYAPSGNFGSSDAQLTTGVRLVLGAATATALSSANNANASQQTVQIANLYRKPSVSNAASSVTPIANLSGPAKLNLSGGQDGQLVQITSTVSGSTLSNTSLSASASNSSSLNQLFAGATARTTATPIWSVDQGSGTPSLQTLGDYGDLNADGYVDYLDAIPTTVYGPDGLSWRVWSIRAAGDANGNGVDDVLLSLSPMGPAYGQLIAGQPSDLQSVLVDGSLFIVDKTTNSYRLDQLRTPLNPYNRSQLYDVASTSTSDYLPSLQNWFEPILNFSPGSLTAASTTNSINPAGARSFTEPAVAISPNGGAYLVISGADTSGPNGASGLWMAYQQAGNWQQTSLPVGGEARYYSPSATFYQGKLYIAYSDTSGNLHIAYCDSSPENTSSSNWHSYQVTTTTNESTNSTPTLVAEAGRLALYFPSNTPKTSQQSIRYLYSTDPDNSRSGSNINGNWGGSLDTTSGGYTGISGVVDTSGQFVNAPIAATTFHGRTVLAFRSYANSHIYLLMQVASAPTAANSSPSLSWKLTDTGIGDVNGVALTSDQSLLYLTSSSGTVSPSSTIWSLRPNADGSWSKDAQKTVGGSPSVANGLSYGPPPLYLIPTYAPGYGVINPFLSGGQLMAAWTDSSYNIQVANLSPTITAPSQQSLAGYSVDSNIDINGDGFKDILISDPSDSAKSVDNQYAMFGGDYLNIASQAGTSGDDILLGTALADVIYTLQGADQVASQGGADVIYTGAGDDSISIQNNAFIRIDAGSGFDALRLEGQANQSYDFRLNVDNPEYFAGTKLRDIELISSIDYGTNVLSFDAAAINTINPDRALFITPDSQDYIALSSEFQRNTAFDARYGGSLWSAFAAGEQANPASSNPALLFVHIPDGQTPNWLDSHVSTAPLTAFAAAPAETSLLRTTAAPAPSSTYQQPVSARPPSNSGATQPFGSGLTLTASFINPGDNVARFRISRNDTVLRQVVSYATSTKEANAEPGIDYLPSCGVLVFQPGETSKQVAVALRPEVITRLRSAAVSLAVAELPDTGQQELHFNLDTAAADTVATVLSDFCLEPGSEDNSAILSFRADTNSIPSDLSDLKLIIHQRTAADSFTLLASRIVSIADLLQPASAANADEVLQTFDQDGKANGQISVRLALNLAADADQPRLSLLAPALSWSATVQLVGDSAIQFSQDAPLTCWRADSGNDTVSFALQAAGRRETLLQGALGGAAGSISPANALASGWQTSEGRAVGSRASIEIDNLTGSTWIPTASREGIPLALTDLSLAGDQVTASFAGGATAVFWQSTGTATTAAASRPALEVQRLAGFANSIALYSVDAITGSVDGFEPGDPDYLRAALARAKAEDLLLDSGTLPEYGQSATFTNLAINTSKSYGVLLLRNGDPATIFSSFSNANPGAETQMIHLANEANTMVIGIEDIAIASPFSDIDFNDVVLRVTNISLPIL